MSGAVLAAHLTPLYPLEHAEVIKMLISLTEAVPKPKGTHWKVPGSVAHVMHL